MDPIEIGEQVELWLKERPQEVSVPIAARVALRVFPIAMHSDNHDALQETRALLTARCILTTAVVATMPTPEVRVAAEVVRAASPAGYAANNTDAAYAAAAHAADAAANAAHAAADAKDVAARLDAAHAANAARATARAAAVAANAANAANAAAYADIDLALEDMMTAPLWDRPKEPDWLVAALAPYSYILDSGPEWDFWRRWYQGFLIGEPLDWELQRRVALIDNAIWEDGPESVAQKIIEIEAEVLTENTPQAEKVEFNPETAKFFTTPIEIAKPDLLRAVLSQIEDALEDAISNLSNGLRDRSREVVVLRRAAQKYGNDPQRIEMDFTSVHAGITRQLASDELPASEENLALLSALQEGAQGIRATHPEIAENREILSRQAIAELTEEQKAVLEEAQPILDDISEDSLKEQWKEDISFLLEPNVRIGPPYLGPADRNPILAGYDEQIRVFGRVARILIILKKTPDWVHAIDKNAAYKGARILLTLAGLVALGIALF